MKEQENINFESPSHPIRNGEGLTLERTTFPSQNLNIPKPRYKHQFFAYKNRLFVHGGASIPTNDLSDDPLDIFAYDPERVAGDRWERIRTKCSHKQMQVLSGHASALSGNRWFIFGGSNPENKPNNLLWRLNLDTFEWARLQQKGQVPSPRQSSSLFFLQKNWLLLYGGISRSEVQIYNSFSFYNIDTKNWSNCDGTYIYQAYARLDPALCFSQERLYLFGGTYRNCDNEEKYLNDFYEIEVGMPSRNILGKITMKRLTSPSIPESRSGHNLISISSNYLLLINGQNSAMQIRQGLRNEDINLVSNIWIFNTSEKFWMRLELLNQNFKIRTMSSIVNFNQKIYLFGGLLNYSHVLNDLVEISLDLKQLQSLKKIPSTCGKCEQGRLKINNPTAYSTMFIEDICNNIDFPYAAVGLLVDNAKNHGATLVNIIYNQSLGSQKLKVLKFQDNAKLPWTEEEIVDTISNFEAGHTFIPIGNDKKTKINLTKDSLRREFGWNLKVGSLRLGQSFLFISLSSDQIYHRVFLFQKSNKITSQEQYLLHYYSYCEGDNEVTPPHMIETRKMIQSRFGQYIQEAFRRKNANNTLLIINPIIFEMAGVNKQYHQPELKLHSHHNDILYGSLKTITILQNNGFNIMDCVDVSLKAYLTCLYLKNDSMRIIISLNNYDFYEIQTQSFLEKVDKLCRNKHVLEIPFMTEFDLKISQLYYLYDLKKKLNFFSNGVLIYHKNRLITRFKYTLGELLTRKFYKQQGNCNFLRLMGFVELPDHLPVNIFKTAYINYIMLEKFYSRVKVVGKVFKKKLRKMMADPNQRRMETKARDDDQKQIDANEEIQQQLIFKRKLNRTQNDSPRKSKVGPLAYTSLRPPLDSNLSPSLDKNANGMSPTDNLEKLHKKLQHKWEQKNRKRRLKTIKNAIKRSNQKNEQYSSNNKSQNQQDFNQLYNQSIQNSNEYLIKGNDKKQSSVINNIECHHGDFQKQMQKCPIQQISIQQNQQGPHFFIQKQEIGQSQKVENEIKKKHNIQ